MTRAEAQAVLARHSYVPGRDSTLGRPAEAIAEIKAACRALVEADSADARERAEAARLARLPKPPAPVAKRPRTVADMAPRKPAPKPKPVPAPVAEPVPEES